MCLAQFNIKNWNTDLDQEKWKKKDKGTSPHETEK